MSLAVCALRTGTNASIRRSLDLNRSMAHVRC
jgi:hypothetical protein